MNMNTFAGRSVLVIEDESFTRLVVVKMLSTLGFAAVHQAADGESGLTAVDEHKPDAVLCDVEMEPMDGLAFLEALCAQARDHPPVAFMTNRIDPARVEQARALGADVFLTKPARPDTLADALGRMLP